MTVDPVADGELTEALHACAERGDMLRDAERVVVEARELFDAAVVRARAAGASVDEVAAHSGFSRQLASKAFARHELRLHPRPPKPKAKKATKSTKRQRSKA